MITWPVQVGTAIELEVEAAEVATTVADEKEVYAEKLTVVFWPHQAKTFTSSAPR